MGTTKIILAMLYVFMSIFHCRQIYSFFPLIICAQNWFFSWFFLQASQCPAPNCFLLATVLDRTWVVTTTCLWRKTPTRPEARMGGSLLISVAEKYNVLEQSNRRREPETPNVTWHNVSRHWQHGALHVNSTVGQEASLLTEKARTFSLPAITFYPR